VAFKTCRDVRTAIYRNLHTLSLGWYIQHKSGDITKHVVDAKMRLEPGLADTIYGFVTALILAVGGIILLTLSRLLTFLALASLPVAHYIMARIGREAAPRSLKRPIAKRG
ncbi:MAG: ABC transporter transmembrane domain-containing protein, partial [Pseudomonadota bacterium]